MPTSRLQLRSPAGLPWPPQPPPRLHRRLRRPLPHLRLALVAIAYAPFQHATEYTKPHLPNILLTPGLRQLPAVSVKTPLRPPKALSELAQDQNQLGLAMHEVARAGSVQAARPASDSLQRLVSSGIALAMVAVLALLAGWLVAGSMLRSIRTVTRTAQWISSTSLHDRLALDGPQHER